MGEVVNLRQARKQKARADKENTAEANRLKFGRTKGEKLKQAAEKALTEKHVDGHKLED